MSQKHRCAQVTFLVALWMALGYAFRLSTHAYQLVGIPLFVGFQLLVRKQPLITCWLREPGAVRFDLLTGVLTLVLLVVPVTRLLSVEGDEWIERGLLLACSVGAVGAALALRRFTLATIRHLLFCVATAGLPLCALILWQADVQFTTTQATALLEGFLLNLAAGFVIEEVAFRGVLDAHIHHAHDSQPWLSAIGLSLLWGWWHLPVRSGIPPIYNLVIFPLVALVPGVSFSIAWRRTGNLAVPAVVHALINAVAYAFAVGIPPT